MKDLLCEVNASIFMEYNRSVEKFGVANNSHHESYAVILEEFEGAKEQAETFASQFEHYWTLIKMSKFDEAQSKLDNMRYFAERAAAEWIQVAAMCFRATRKPAPKPDLRCMECIKTDGGTE